MIIYFKYWRLSSEREIELKKEGKLFGMPAPSDLRRWYRSRKNDFVPASHGGLAQCVLVVSDVRREAEYLEVNGQKRHIGEMRSVLGEKKFIGHALCSLEDQFVYSEARQRSFERAENILFGAIWSEDTDFALTMARSDAGIISHALASVAEDTDYQGSLSALREALNRVKIRGVVDQI